MKVTIRYDPGYSKEVTEKPHCDFDIELATNLNNFVHDVGKAIEGIKEIKAKHNI